MQRADLQQDHPFFRPAHSFRNPSADVQCGGSDRARTLRLAGSNGGGRGDGLPHKPHRQRVHRTLHRDKRPRGELSRREKLEEHQPNRSHGNRGLPRGRRCARSHRNSDFKTAAGNDVHAGRHHRHGDSLHVDLLCGSPVHSALQFRQCRDARGGRYAASALLSGDCRNRQCHSQHCLRARSAH